MDPALQIPFLLITILLSAFFSGVEIAFVTSDRVKLELDKGGNSPTARLLRLVTSSPSRLLGTLLIGNNICLVVYGILMETLLYGPINGFFTRYFESGLGFAILLTQTVISTIIIMIMGEYVPKALFRINPNNTFKLLVFPITVFYYLLLLPVSMTLSITRFILRRFFRAPVEEEAVSFERTDLDYYLRRISEDEKEASQNIENEVKILKNALEFPSIRAKECMIPRTEVVNIDIQSSVTELQELFARTGLSKIMIYRDNVDDMIGYVHSFALFKKPATIESVMMPVLIVPETMLVKDILTQFIQQHRSMAIVVDEYGGTAGILTTEDIIEEIIGDIEDEHDREVLMEKQLSENEFQLSARLEIDYVNDTYGLHLPEDEEYETLAGLIIHHLQRIPQRDELLRINGYLLRVTKVSENKIEEVHLALYETGEN